MSEEIKIFSVCIRKNNNSFIITLPIVITKLYNLEENDIIELQIINISKNKKK